MIDVGFKIVKPSKNGLDKAEVAFFTKKITTICTKCLRVDRYQMFEENTYKKKTEEKNIFLENDIKSYPV